MDIAIAASLIIFGTERVVELIKSSSAKWKEYYVIRIKRQ